jgi:exopolyphosphatase/pppGpp-phosphohydrolase
VRRIARHDPLAIHFEEATASAAVLETFDRETLVVSDRGLREGVILEALTSGPDTSAVR